MGRSSQGSKSWLVIGPLLICFETQMNTVHNLHRFLNLQELWSNYKAFILQYLLLHSINNVELPDELLKVFEIPTTEKSKGGKGKSTKKSKGGKGKSHAKKELFEKMKFGSQEKITKGSSVPTNWSTEIPSEKTMPLMSNLKKFIDDDHKDNGGYFFCLLFASSIL